MIFVIFKRITCVGLILAISFNSSVLAAPQKQKKEIQRMTHLLTEEMSAPLVVRIKIAKHILNLSREYNLDPLLVLAIIKTESRFRPDAKSHVGAIGMMQVMPIVIRQVGHEVNVHSREELYDPMKNILLGIRYFSYLLNQYRNNVQKALVAYNMGPTALNSRISKKASFPLTYYRKVMDFYANFQNRMQELKNT